MLSAAIELALSKVVQVSQLQLALRAKHMNTIARSKTEFLDLRCFAARQLCLVLTQDIFVLQLAKLVKAGLMHLSQFREDMTLVAFTLNSTRKP